MTILGAGPPVPRVTGTDQLRHVNGASSGSLSRPRRLLGLICNQTRRRALALLASEIRDKRIQRAARLLKERLPGGEYFLDDWILAHGSIPHQLFGSADSRRRKTAIRANLFDTMTHLSVDNMPKIPGEQEIHPVRGGNADVQSIRCRNAR